MHPLFLNNTNQKTFFKKYRQRAIINFTILQIIIFLIIISVTSQAQYCNSTSCYPCYYKCKTCSGLYQSQCNQCQQEYVNFNGTCYSCGDNCQSCKNNITGIVTIQNVQTYCESCISGYYLSQATGICNKCPTGAQSCTLSQIQACLSQYYLSNGVCLKCVSNCLTCTSASICKQCMNKYTLSGSSCVSCAYQNCSQCQNSTSICDSCVARMTGDYCNSTCSDYCSVCYSGVCYLCQNAYYYSSSSGKCQPMTVLCQIGNSFQSCGQCNSQISRMGTDGYCIPSYIVDDYNQLIYLTALNNPQTFSIDNSTTLQSSKRCTNLGSVSNSYWIRSMTDGFIQVSQYIPAVYQVYVVVQVQVSTVPSTITVSCQNMQSPSTIVLEFQSSLSKVVCPQTTYIKNFEFSFIPSDNFNVSQTPLILTFTSTNTTTSFQIGISQIYIELFRCLVANCQICQSSYTCKSCSYPYKLQNNLCESICYEGMYFNQDLMTCSYQCTDGYYAVLQDYLCLKCPFPCVYCDFQIICLMCYVGWYLNINKTCVDTCENGYYKNNSSWTCQYCVYPCMQCQSMDECTSCQIGYLVPNNKSCAYQCSAGFYTNFSLLACQACIYPCNSCKYSSTTCTSCQNFSYLYANDCYSECPEGYAQIYYSSNSSSECVQCRFPCKTCKNSTKICLSCIEGYLYEGLCYNQCPITYYQNVDNNTCSQCTSPCQTCSDITVCLSCIVNYKLIISESSCAISCPNTTYTSTKYSNNATTQVCLICIPPCLQCLNRTYCLSCTGLLFLNHLGQCLLQCPISTYIFYNQTIEVRQCTNCPINCASCSSQSNCLQCISSSLYQGICYLTCPNQTFAYLGFWICQKCLYPCFTCSNQYECLSCSNQFLFVEDSYNCVQYCPAGYFQAFVNASCLPCDSQCQTCETSASNCIQCATGYQKLTQVGECVSTCPSGYYVSTINKVCSKCFQPCVECLSSISCTMCNSNSTSPILYMYNCLSQCPKHMFQQLVNQTLTCSFCKYPCSSCQNMEQNCMACSYNFYFYYNSTSNMGECLQNCPSTYFSFLGQCQLCVYPCQTCVDQIYCSTCQNNLILYDYQCLDFCPFHYFKQTINNFSVCSECSDICRQCTNFDACVSCSSNKFLLNQSTCVAACPSYYYGYTSTMTCQPCVFPCFECYTGIYCKSCQIGYFLQSSSCVTECQDGYYKNTSLGMCSQCTSPCKTCQNQTACLSCVIGLFYISANNSCQKLCPQTQYEYLSPTGYGTCLNCSSYCYECVDYSYCLSCPSNSTRKYLQNGICQTSCSQGYFVTQSLNSNNSLVCSKCKSMCVDCLEYDVCLKCISSFLLNGSCASQCPSLFYSSTFYTCQSCQSPCLECYNQASCISCQQNYYLYNNICVKKCPVNMWTDIQLQQCVYNCSSMKFMNIPNKTCLGECQRFYSLDRYCKQVCQSNQFINKSLGCQTCQQQLTKCQGLPQYQTQFIFEQSKFFLLLIFSQQINHYHFQPNDFQLSLFKNQINNNQLDIAIFRNLQQTSNITTIYIDSSLVSIDQINQNSIWLNVYLPHKSGLLTLNQTKFISLLSANHQQIPLQTLSFSSEIENFHPVSIPSQLSYVSLFLSFLIILILLINLVLDNFRSTFILVDSIQIIWITVMGFQGWTGLQDIMSGFSIIMGVGFTKPAQYSQLWNCSGKDIYYFGGCSFLQKSIYLSIAIGAFIAIVIISKLAMQRLKHEIVYNHVNNFYWMFSCPILFIACKQYAYSSSIIALIAICFMGIYTIVLSYQILKNVFNCSFSELTFFWNLKRHKLDNQIGNLHFLLLVIRKSIVVFTVCLFPQTTLTAMFLVSLTSIIILSNMITNMPFKKHQILLITIEVLMICFYFGLEIFWVNIKKLEDTQFLTWNGGLTAVIFTSAGLTIYIVLIQTIKCIKKVYKKYKNKPEQGESKQQKQKQNQKQSQSSQNTIKSKSSIQKQQKQKQSKQQQQQEQEQTQQKLNSDNLNKDSNKQLIKPSSSQRSSSSLEEHSELTFSSNGLSQEASYFQKPAKYLVRVQKNEDPKKQK